MNWNNYPNFFNRGIYIARVIAKKELSTHDLSSLPNQHNGRNTEAFKYERAEIIELEMPILNKIVNKLEVFFEGAKPRIELE